MTRMQQILIDRHCAENKFFLRKIKKSHIFDSWYLKKYNFPFLSSQL